MSLAAIQGKLSRAEMKNVLAGEQTIEEENPGDGCKSSGSECTKNSQCCSNSCADNGNTGKKYCDGA